MSNKTPKEIYINNEWQHSFGCKISKKFASDEQLEETQVKYLSEEHFNSLIEKWKDEEKNWIKQIESLNIRLINLNVSLEEKDKEIKRLQNIINGPCIVCEKLKDKCNCTASTRY